MLLRFLGYILRLLECRVPNRFTITQFRKIKRLIELQPFHLSFGYTLVAWFFYLIILRS